MADLRGRRLLLIEDEPLIAWVVEDLLATIGIEVVERAGTLEEAQRAAHQGGFEAAIVDINLGGQMSYPAVQTLAARGIPVLFMSGYVREAAPPELRHIPLVAKPFRTDEMIDALARVLAGARAG